MPVGFSPTELKPHIAELQRLAASEGRSALEVVHMKSLPLDDPPAALAMAAAYAEVGVTHLVHPQGVKDEKEFGTMVDTLCTGIQFALNDMPDGAGLCY